MDYQFGKVAWTKEGVTTTSGNSTCIQAGYKYEQPVNTETTLRFKVAGCARSGDGSPAHFNSGFTVKVYVYYKLNDGNWVELGNKTGSTDFHSANTWSGYFGSETPVAGWYDTPTINRKKTSQKIKFMTKITSNSFDTAYSESNWITIYPITSYTMTYTSSVNGTTTNMPSNGTKYHGENYTVTSTIPRNDIHDFKYWKINNTVYTPNVTQYTINASATFSASWEEKKYAVTYDANGGTNTPAIQYKLYTQDLTLTAATPTYEGNLFEYWSTTSDDTGNPIHYNPEQIYTNNAALALYATWTPAQYTISYDANGGINTPSEQIKNYGDINFTITSSVPTRPGYNFLDWSRAKNGPVYISPSATYTPNESIVLYARWETAHVYVNYAVDISSEDFYKKQRIQRDLLWFIDATPPVRNYYVFNGWSTTSSVEDPSLPLFNYGDSMEGITSDLTLYANWSLDQYTVNYNVNGGIEIPSQTETCSNNITIATPSHNSINTNYGATFTIAVGDSNKGKFSDNSGDQFKRIVDTATTNYNFIYWTDTNKTTITYAAGATYPSDGKFDSTTLLANWNSSTTYPTISIPNVTACPGFQFKEWAWYNQSEDRAFGPTDTAVTLTANVSYIAKWIPTTYTVTYWAGDAGDAQVETASLPSVTTHDLYKDFVPSAQIPICIYPATASENKHYWVTYNYQYDNLSYPENIGKTREFLGWRNELDQTETPTLYIYGGSYPGGLTETPGININLIAQWGNMTDGTHLIDPGDREGYTFRGWYKDSNYIEFAGYAGDYLAPTEYRDDIVLFAKWVPLIYQINYWKDSTYTISILPSQEGKYGDTLAITESQPTGKNQKESEPHEYEVTYYYYQDGEMSSTIEEFNVVDTFQFNGWLDWKNELHKANEKWNTKASIEEWATKIEENVLIGYKLDLIPQWDTTSHFPQLTLPKIEDEKFIGWKIFKVEDDQEIYIDSIDKLTEYTPSVRGNIVVRAQYETDKWSIKYDCNGGLYNEEESWIESQNPTAITSVIPTHATTSAEYAVIIYNEQNTTAPPQITVTPYYNYEFVNWNKKIDGTGIGYESNQEYQEGRDAVLYAKWDKSVNTASTTPYSVPLSISNWIGYNFEGWYWDSRFNSSTLISETPSLDYIPSRDTNIYAKWSKKEYQIEYDVNGGRINSCPKSQIKKYNEDIALSNKIPTYLDYVFVEWQSEIGNETITPVLINDNEFNNNNYEIQYCLSNSESNPGDSWIYTERPEQTENTYTWARVKILWPNSVNPQYTNPVYIGKEYQNNEIIIEYCLTDTQQIPSEDNERWTTEWQIRTDGIYRYARLSVKWYATFQPEEIYTYNRSMTGDQRLFAQWRKIRTLTEWLTNWEATTASVEADLPGNNLILWTNDGTNTAVETYSYSELINALHEKINNVEHVYGQGYKLKLDLINPYNNTDEKGNIEKLSRTIFVPAKIEQDENQQNIYTGYYEVPEGVKIAEATVFNGAQVSVEYKAHMNLNYIESANTPQIYEVIDQVIGQLSGPWIKNQNITTLLKAKYYAKDENDDMIYEYSLDSWHIHSIDGPEGIQFKISTVNNPKLITYTLDSVGLYILDQESEKQYLDLDEQINQCAIISELNNEKLLINYWANIVQRVYI